MLKGKFLQTDGQTLTANELGQAKQVEGTDGGGGHLHHDELTVNASVRAAGYFDTTYPPSYKSMQLLIDDGSGHMSQLTEGLHFTICRSAVNGMYRRIVFDSTATPGGVAIPDSNDTAPSQGLESRLVDDEKFILYYAR